MNKKDIYPLILLILTICVWIWGAIRPLYRSVWIAENILAVAFILILVFSYIKFRFSNLSYTLLFVFMVLHLIGGHYTYNEVPFFDDLQSHYGFERNNYDRVVHFLFGVLFFVPFVEIFSTKLKRKDWFVYFVVFLSIVGIKGIFELIEWQYGVRFQGGLLETNYVGMQGDVWDAQKDVFLGMIGALISWVFYGFGRLFSGRVEKF
jgi:putative membrane protein